MRCNRTNVMAMAEFVCGTHDITYWRFTAAVCEHTSEPGTILVLSLLRLEGIALSSHRSYMRVRVICSKPAVGFTKDQAPAAILT